MPAPPNALCVFAAGACGFAAQRLLALAHTRNVLQYRDPLARVWHVMTLDEHSADLTFTSAAYGWLPVLNPRRGEVVLIPADRGLCRLWINPVSETCRAEPVFDAAIASAPGAAGRHVACLFSSACGTRLWSALADGAQVALHDCAAAPAAGWMRPVSYDGRILWLHPFGQLIWQPGAPPQWRPWPRGFSARLELGGPTQSCDGRLWHIGHAGQQYAFIELGRDKPQMEPISGAPACATSHVFLVQNSGWMAPFYTDPASPYKALVSELVMAATQPGERMVLASFNQSLPGAPSPKALLSLTLDATSASLRAQAGKPGLVWLFTNNRNSPNNDQATVLRNREFYALIHHGGAIARFS